MSGVNYQTLISHESIHEQYLDKWVRLSADNILSLETETWVSWSFYVSPNILWRVSLATEKGTGHPEFIGDANQMVDQIGPLGHRLPTLVPLFLDGVCFSKSSREWLLQTQPPCRTTRGMVLDQEIQLGCFKPIRLGDGLLVNLYVSLICLINY